MKRVGFYTLGCKVSQYETEAVAEIFAKKGYCVSDFSDVCDVYVINTCTVTAEADRKSRQIIRRAKAKNPDAKVIVCGCYSQRSPGEVAAIDGVDAVIGSSGKCKLADIADELIRSGRRVVEVTDINAEPFEPMRISGGKRTRVYVKIEDGCESKCSYCAIPSARGRVRSKPRQDVIEEVESLSASGVREVVLTGIETGSYGRDFAEPYSLADLIAELNERKSAKRIRLGSLAPELVGESFVKKVEGCAILAPHFHLSLQSGSDKILAAMRRRYTRKTALENIARLRKAFPYASFTTDIMVGFPGESEEDFKESVSFVREARFLDAHVFCYSKRKDTPAALFANQIPEDVKKRRSEELMAVVAEVSSEILDEAVKEKRPLACIFEQEKDGLWTGHSDSFIEVAVESKCDLRGKEISVIPQERVGRIIRGIIANM